MSETFTKLFSSITDSTIWSQDNETRLVWITMLAMCDGTGYVGASVDGLARRANVSLDATERALAAFLAPDRRSRSQEHEGRRIAVAERGWTLINYRRFREMRDQDLRREGNRLNKRAQRERAKLSRTSQQSQPSSAAVSPSRSDQIQIREDPDPESLPISDTRDEHGATRDATAGDRPPRTTTELLRLYEHHWKARWNLPWRQTQWDQKTGDALMRLPDLAELEPAIKRYLRSTEKLYVEKKHPLALLERNFDAFRRSPRPPQDDAVARSDAYLAQMTQPAPWPKETKENP
jgi:hypothetical protein